MNERYEQDVLMGDKNETKFKDFIEKTEFIKLNKYKDKYAELDFRYLNRRLELKSRGISFKEFPSTIVGYNKIIKTRKRQRKNLDTEFYFLFTDGLYKWNYNEEEISCIMPTRRIDRGKIEVKDHAYIPTRYLKFMSSEILSVD